MFSLPYVVIMAGLSFGGAMTVIGFGGLLGAWFHRELGTPLPLPTLHGPVEKKLYTGVGIAGFVVCGSAFLWSLKLLP